MNISLRNLFEFTKFTHKYQKVIRTIYIFNEDRKENDLEHSGQLALIAWYIIDTEKLKLNKEKVFEYCLAHDLVEIYAGDTNYYSKDKSFKDSKYQREKDALKKIKKEFPQFKTVHKIIKEFEEKKDPEARFVYALDKMLPVINNVINSGRNWKEENINLEMVKTKDDKIALSPELKTYWKDLKELLEKNKKKLFNK